jgi:hypothetical protein
MSYAARNSMNRFDNLLDAWGWMLLSLFSFDYFHS